MDYRDPDWLADRLGLERNTVYRFLQDGTIPALHLGRKWLVSEKRLEEWLASETDKQTKARREAAKSSEAVVRRMDHFTADARQALRRAHAEARGAAHAEMDQLHLLLGLAEDGKSSAGRALKRIGVTREKIAQAIESSLTPGEQPAPRRLPRNSDAKRAMRLASRMALRDGANDPLSPVGTDQLLTGIFLARSGKGHELLAHLGVTRERLKEALQKEKHHDA